METIDSLYSENIKLIQARDGYRFGLDPVLLADFVTLRGEELVLDLGCGCGVLPLLLARRSSGLRIVGWERQSQMVERARRSVELGRVAERISIVEADLRGYRELVAAGTFGLVVSNPPFRAAGTGRIAPDDERAAARHELAGGLTDFLAAASWALKYGGRLAIVYLAERLSELLVAMSAVGVEPKRLRVVHPRQGAPGRLVLVEGVRGGSPGIDIETPLYVYSEGDGGRDYTDELLRIYGE